MTDAYSTAISGLHCSERKWSNGMINVDEWHAEQRETLRAFYHQHMLELLLLQEAQLAVGQDVLGCEGTD